MRKRKGEVGKCRENVVEVPLVQEERGGSAAHIPLKAGDFYNFANSLGEVVRELHSIYSSAGSSR